MSEARAGGNKEAKKPKSEKGQGAGTAYKQDHAKAPSSSSINRRA